MTRSLIEGNQDLKSLIFKVADIYGLGILLLFISAILLVVFSIYLIKRQWKRNARENKKRALAFTAMICLAATCGSFLAIANASSLTEMRWRWEHEKRLFYTVEARVNVTGGYEIIVPVPANESVLSGLVITNGSAQHEIIDTIHGRGLRIESAGGNVTLESTTVTYETLGNISLSMAVGQEESCSDYHAWFYFATNGTLTSIDLSLNRYFTALDWFEPMEVEANLVPGWNLIMVEWNCYS